MKGCKHCKAAMDDGRTMHPWDGTGEKPVRDMFYMVVTCGGCGTTWMPVEPKGPTPTVEQLRSQVAELKDGLAERGRSSARPSR